eukprot:scaffold7026_cov65-Phaeocystis_antarctica.AAC.14
MSRSQDRALAGIHIGAASAASAARSTPPPPAAVRYSRPKMARLAGAVVGRRPRRHRRLRRRIRLRCCPCSGHQWLLLGQHLTALPRLLRRRVCCFRWRASLSAEDFLVAPLLLAPLAGPLLELCSNLRLLEDGPHRGAVLIGDAAQAGVALVIVMLLEEALQLAQRRAARGLVLVVALLHLGVHGAELLNRALLCAGRSVACQM